MRYPAPSLAIMVQEGCNQPMEDSQLHGRGRIQAHLQGTGQERLEVDRTSAGGRARGSVHGHNIHSKIVLLLLELKYYEYLVDI